jgi:hypothetical protein
MSRVEVRANGQFRLELPPVNRRSWFKSIGCFTEIIAFRTRILPPRDRASTILAALATND